MKKPPTNFEDFYKYLSNNDLQKIIEKSVEISLQYRKAWFSQNQQLMEKELSKFDTLCKDFTNNAEMIFRQLSKRIKSEYLERVSSYNWKEWTLERLKQKYEHNQDK